MAFVSALPISFTSTLSRCSTNNKHNKTLVMRAEPKKKARGVVKSIAVAAMAALLAMPSNEALAAVSSGRIGGSNFSSSPVAARSGGRVGGSSFRTAPAPSRPSSSGSYYRSGPTYYGGYSPVMPVSPFFFSPFSAPGFFLFSGGASSLIGTAAVLGGAYVLLRGVAFRSGADDDEFAGGVTPDVATLTLKVGLLASATRVRDALDSLAVGGDTSTASGLSSVLRDSVVALMRASDYWVCGSSDINVTKGGAKAERAFNEMSFKERSKLAKESISNVGGVRLTSEVDTTGADPEEYVVVTLVVCVDASVARNIPRRINTTEDVRATLSALGGVYGDQIQGLEVLWAPQARGDSLTRSEMLSDHPDLLAF